MKKLFQIILAVAIVGLVYVIYVQISTPIRFDKETKAKKAQVIDRIKDIRTAQRAFKSKYQHFTASFDSLGFRADRHARTGAQDRRRRRLGGHGHAEEVGQKEY